MDFAKKIAAELSLNENQVTSSIKLLDEGNTIPFIARYRKEVTGGLSDENLRKIAERIEYLKSLEERKQTIYSTLKELNINDEKLFTDIENAETLARLEDLYRPYKPKKVTRASKAKKAGLGPLADYLKTDKTGLFDEEAKKYITEGYETIDKVKQGAFDIIAEEISDNPNYRTFIKDLAFKSGVIECQKVKDANSDKFDNYAQYSRLIKTLKGYNILAINRGVKTKCLTRKIVLDDEKILSHIEMFEIPSKTPYKDEFHSLISDSYERLIRPSVDNDIYATLFESASKDAIEEFKTSLKATLLVPPLKGRKVLGFDPGFSHGCKLAFVDENGKVIYTYVLNNPFMNEKSLSNSKIILQNLLTKFQTYTVALGNGTANRESEKLLKEIKKEMLPDLDIVIVSESGASIYSATPLANKEFPQYEPNIRSAISIARRLQDPLAELVKIPPESIGVGQYQYDINQKELSEALNGVVEDTVNYVGVILNTASVALLSYVSGISSKIAQSIVDFREKNGPFKSRKELEKVPYLGPKAFQNCAGFLRIDDGVEPLDNTSVHPESYSIAREILKEFSCSTIYEAKDKLKSINDDDIINLSNKLNVGQYTLQDIIKELISPSRDPRLEAKTAKLSETVLDIKDLKPGMILEGTIRNVTGFGFFVDLGIEINGLVHLSEIADAYVTDPHDYGKPGDIVKVKVLQVDLNRQRISLTMKGLKQER